MPDNDKLLSRFKQLFSGGQDRWVIHAPPFSKDDKKGKLTANFCGFAKYGSASFPDVPDGHEKGDFVPVSIDIYKAHLNGTFGVALSPLINQIRISGKELRNVCAYGVIDIDVYDYDFMPLIGRLYADGFKFSAFRSKSGGLHLYFIFSGYENAAEVRIALNKIVMLYGMAKLFNDGKVSKVEVFPEHDEVKPGVNDKGVFLPLFNSVDECPNKLVSADGVLLGIQKAIPIVESQMTTLEALNNVITALPYGDAPYCIQAILLSGALWSGSHRNDFLFTVAIYLKMKLGADGLTVDAISEANERLIEPLESTDVASCYNSVASRDYPILGQCKKEPMCSFCDRKQCKERAFSAVKKDKGNVSSNIEFGQVVRMKAETPYYMLEARLAGTEDEFKLLRLDTSENLLNQRMVQKECIDKLNQVMWTVKQQVWEERLNDVMSRIVEKEVARETDTTEMSDLRELFYRYLTHKQAQANSPYRVVLKQVYVADGTYYFRTDGFKEYLRIAKFVIGRTNLREQLVSYGCKEGSIDYTRRDGTAQRLTCWSKPTDGVLENMTVIYDDATDQDEEVIEQNKLDKVEGDTTNPVDDRRF